MPNKGLIKPIVLSLAALWGTEGALAQNPEAPPLPQNQNQPEKLAKPEVDPEQKKFEEDLQSAYKETFNNSFAFRIRKKLAALRAAYQDTKPLLLTICDNEDDEPKQRTDFENLRKDLIVLAWVDKEIKHDISPFGNNPDTIDRHAIRLEFVSNDVDQCLAICKKYQLTQIASYIQDRYHSSIEMLERSIDQSLIDPRVESDYDNGLNLFRSKLLLEAARANLGMDSQYASWLETPPAKALTTNLDREIKTKLDPRSFQQNPSSYAITANEIYDCLEFLESMKVKNPLSLSSQKIIAKVKALYDPMFKEMLDQLKQVIAEADVAGIKAALLPIAEFEEYSYYINFIGSDYDKNFLAVIDSDPVLQELERTQLDPELTEAQRTTFLSNNQEHIDAMLSTKKNKYPGLSHFLASRILNRIYQNSYQELKTELLKAKPNFELVRSKLDRLDAFKDYLYSFSSSIPLYRQPIAALPQEIESIWGSMPELIDSCSNKEELMQALTNSRTIRRFIGTCFSSGFRWRISRQDRIMLDEARTTAHRSQKQLLRKIVRGQLKLNRDQLELVQIYQGLSTEFWAILHGGSAKVIDKRRPIKPPQIKTKEAGLMINQALSLDSDPELKLELLTQIIRAADANLNSDTLAELETFLDSCLLDPKQGSPKSISQLLHALIQGQDSKAIFVDFDSETNYAMRVAMGLDIFDASSGFVPDTPGTGRLLRDLKHEAIRLPNRSLAPEFLGQFHIPPQSKAPIKTGLELAEKYLHAGLGSLQTLAQVTGNSTARSFENLVRQTELQARAYAISASLMPDLKHITGEKREELLLRREYFQSLQELLTDPERLRFISPKIYGSIITDWVTWLHDSASGQIGDDHYQISPQELEKIKLYLNRLIFDPGVFSEAMLGPEYQERSKAFALDLSMIPKLDEIKDTYPILTEHQILVAYQIASSKRHRQVKSLMKELQLFSGQTYFWSLIDDFVRQRSEAGHNR
ncbi:MAG: hypothetical protein OXU45_00115 [Candidatus Melainabacteria bacterium]|nr:hypothetical protein [Candidatus Melainabacteria bacterium]